MATCIYLCFIFVNNIPKNIMFERCLHTCHFKNCYKYGAVNAEKYLQCKIFKYSKNNFLLKRKLFTSSTSIIVNKIPSFQTLARRNFHKIQFLKQRTSSNTFEIRIRITEKTHYPKRPIIFNMKSKHFNSFFNTFLPTSQSIYFGGTDYLSSSMNLCYVVFESVRLIGRRLSFLKRGLEASPPLNLPPNPSSSTVVKNNSETRNIKETLAAPPVSQQFTEQIDLVPGYMKSPNKRLKTSFNMKLPGDSSSSELNLDCLSRKKSNCSSESSSNIIKSEFPQDTDKRFCYKTRPNYFVAVQISNPKIHENIQEIQQHILTQDSNFNECMIPTPTLHITLMVMNISDTETHEKALQALSNIHKEHNEIMCQNPLILEFCGLSHFRNKVVFGKIKENESYTRLCQLADSVEKHFAVFDIFTTDEDRDFNPHLTLAKMKFPNRNKKRPNKFHPSLYAKFVNNHLGIETIHSIQLLRMDGPKDFNGYYTGDELIFSLPSSSFSRMPNITAKKKEIKEKIAQTTKHLNKVPSKDNTID